MQTVPELIAYAGRRMFERHLTDMAGGNLSVRAGDTIYITPRYAGSRMHWQLDPADILSGLLEGDELLRNPACTREAKTHLAIYHAFPDAQAVVHGHPLHVMPFCAAGISVPPMLEANDKFGVVPCVPYAPAHSTALAEYVVAGLRGQEERMRTQAAAVLMHRHGPILAAKDLLSGLDALERIDTNCYCILAQKLLS